MQDGPPSEAETPQGESPLPRSRRQSSPELRFAIRAYMYGFLIFVVGSLYILPSLSRVGQGFNYACSYCVGVLLGPFPWAARFLQAQAYTAEHATLQSILHIASVVLVIAAIVFPLVVFYGLAWLHRRRRRVALLAIGGGLVAACALGIFHEAYAKREDRTEKGLNPERDGFTPASIWLSGTVSTTNMSRASRSTRFDLIVAGSDHGYLKIWKPLAHGRIRAHGFDNVCIQIPGHLDCRNTVRHSPAILLNGYPNSLRLAMRAVWPPDSTVPESRPGTFDDGSTEIHVHSVTNLGRFTVPLVFETPINGMQVQFKVTRIEFHGMPNPEWIRAAYFRQFGNPRPDAGPPAEFKKGPPEPGWRKTVDP